LALFLRHGLILRRLAFPVHMPPPPVREEKETGGGESDTTRPLEMCVSPFSVHEPRQVKRVPAFRGSSERGTKYFASKINDDS